MTPAWSIFTRVSASVLPALLFSNVFLTQKKNTLSWLALDPPSLTNPTPDRIALDCHARLTLSVQSLVALLSDDAFDYDYDGGVHTAKVIGNYTVADVNHDVEVGHTRKYEKGASLYSQSRPRHGPPRKAPAVALVH